MPDMTATPLDREVCERARLARDARFDGRFFVGVTTTGIFCRPICPVRPAKERNVRYFPSAAAAADAGFRPCLRCRPEAAPGTPAWRGTAATVSRALRLIAEGALDDGGVEDLAARLGIGARHLTRLFKRHLGATPRAVAATRRLLFAKKLLDETDLPLAQVAHGAGFGSLRRFNEVFRRTYGSAPGALRRAGRRRAGGLAADGLVLRLPFRPPLDWSALTRYLGARAIPGVECVAQDAYRRSLAIDGQASRIAIHPVPGQNHLELRVEAAPAGALLLLVERARRLFDLDADPADIAAHLARDRALAPAVRAQKGLRVPGAWDGFELAVRAILGQQVSVKGATTLAGRIVEAAGTPLADGQELGLTHLFPSPRALAEADLTGIGLPRARAEAIRALAEAVDRGEVAFDAAADPAVLQRQLTALPGIGPWTAQYIAMRALGEPDAFPERDLGLLRSAARLGLAPDAAGLLARAEAWRPWRAYAAVCLWQAEPVTDKSAGGKPRRRRPRSEREAEHVLQPHG